MGLFVASLASGSNGNCYYVANENEAVLIDAGILCKELEKRMNRLHLEMKKVKAIFVSHEHTDHISGLKVISKKYNLPVYITAATLQNTRSGIERQCIKLFAPGDVVAVGSLTIKTFLKSHDAAEPCSFTVGGNGVTIGVFTDIGNVCNQVIENFSHCHAAFLEANYDEEMLENGSYPFFLKNRIRGDKGHLSNKDALWVFMKHRPSFMSHLFLSHLSKNNNCPKLVQALFDEETADVQIIVASRYEQSALYTIGENAANESDVKTLSTVNKNPQSFFNSYAPSQLTIVFE